ncbi:hypothetical protein C5167_042023 [Papaver somniferum]|nr:hypothetical protein C5167_042023 [Papaver somniferum]
MMLLQERLKSRNQPRGLSAGGVVPEELRARSEQGSWVVPVIMAELKEIEDGGYCNGGRSRSDGVSNLCCKQT